MIALGDVLTFATEQGMVAPPWLLNVHRSARADGTLVWLWLSLIAVAPIGEELLFRGFLFRGFIHVPRDRLPGIVVIALLWSVAHIQYNWIGMGEVFVIGLVLGYVRLRTGSTLLVIALHVLGNLNATVRTVVALGWI